MSPNLGELAALIARKLEEEGLTVDAGHGYDNGPYEDLTVEMNGYTGYVEIRDAVTDDLEPDENFDDFDKLY